MAAQRTLWEQGTEPGREVVALGVAVTLTLVIVDVLVSDGLGWIFDVGFILLCIAVALRVRPEDFFTVAVLPPLLMFGVFWVVNWLAPGAIAPADDGNIQGSINAMAHHPEPLLLGYAFCLSVIQIRRRWLQSSKRSGSPAPRRTT